MRWSGAILPHLRPDAHRAPPQGLPFAAEVNRRSERVWRFSRDGSGILSKPPDGGNLGAPGGHALPMSFGLLSVWIAAATAQVRYQVTSGTGEIRSAWASMSR